MAGIAGKKARILHVVGTPYDRPAAPRVLVAGMKRTPDPAPDPALDPALTGPVDTEANATPAQPDPPRCRPWGRYGKGGERRARWQAEWEAEKQARADKEAAKMAPKLAKQEESRRYQQFTRQARALTANQPLHLVPGAHLRGKNFHLDHAIPLRTAYDLGWGPEEVADVSNLQVIPASENIAKKNLAYSSLAARALPLPPRTATPLPLTPAMMPEPYALPMAA